MMKNKILIIVIIIGIVIAALGCVSVDDGEEFEITEITDFAKNENVDKVVVDGNEYNVVLGESVNYDCNENYGIFVSKLKGRNELYKIVDEENNVTIYYTYNEWNKNDIGISAVKN